MGKSAGGREDSPSSAQELRTLASMIFLPNKMVIQGHI